MKNIQWSLNPLSSWWSRNITYSWCISAQLVNALTSLIYVLPVQWCTETRWLVNKLVFTLDKTERKDQLVSEFFCIFPYGTRLVLVSRSRFVPNFGSPFVLGSHFRLVWSFCARSFLICSWFVFTFCILLFPFRLRLSSAYFSFAIVIFSILALV